MTPEEDPMARMVATRKDASGLSVDTPVRFSLVQMCIICGALVSGTCVVLKYVDEVRQSVEQLNRRVGQIEEGFKDTNVRLKLDDVRSREWDNWRWTMTRDMGQMGRKTGVEIWTKEDK